MIEVELKAVVDDLDRRRALVEAAGGRLAYAGRLEDRRWDTPDRALGQRDEVLRVRVYRSTAGARGSLDWKGPTTFDNGYKRREELTTTAEPEALEAILRRLGMIVTRAIDREIVQYELDGAVVRFERYPRMDVLVEVEGSPDAIERAIVVIGLPRANFTSERLPDFVRRYERRTGGSAALCDAELTGPASYRLEDA
jgi:predicted adenylyl cyclase CyaB